MARQVIGQEERLLRLPLAAFTTRERWIMTTADDSSASAKTAPARAAPAGAAPANEEIRRRMDSWLGAVRAGDIDAIMSHYTKDVVAFDAVLQLQFKGLDAYRKHWQACLDMCPGPMIFQDAETDIQASGDLAVVRGLIRCGTESATGEEQAGWMRMTATYRKTGEGWRIAHEHFSAPFDMRSCKAIFDLTPEGGPAVRAIPSDMNSVTPHLVCADAARAIEFYKQAFGAVQESRMDTPQGKVAHACLRIGNAAVFLADEFPEWGSVGPNALKGTPVTVHLYVDNADKVQAAAIAAGAKEIMAVQDMFWGDRYGQVQDPYGHRWSIATHTRNLTQAEIEEGAKQMMGGNCPGDQAQA